jgi:hypothetical protein
MNRDWHLKDTHHPLCHCFECRPRVGITGVSHPYNCDCSWCKEYGPGDAREYKSHRTPEVYFITTENTSSKETKEPEEVNVNLNLFLKMLGATNEIICDDQKTLEFMFDIKNKLDGLNKAPDGTNNTFFGRRDNTLGQMINIEADE